VETMRIYSSSTHSASRGRASRGREYPVNGQETLRVGKMGLRSLAGLVAMLRKVFKNNIKLDAYSPLRFDSSDYTVEN
jgi:hypothetical protein